MGRSNWRNSLPKPGSGRVMACSKSGRKARGARLRESTEINWETKYHLMGWALVRILLYTPKGRAFYSGMYKKKKYMFLLSREE